MLTEHLAALGGPASKDTSVRWVRPPAVALTVFSSALGDRSVALKAPSRSVVPVVVEKVLELPVEESDTNRPGTGLPFTSRKNAERGVVETPSAGTCCGVALICEVAALGGPGVKVM